MAKKIVKIEASVAQEMGSAALFGVYTMGRLRDAGIPVIGSTWPVGVTYGRLASYIEYDVIDGDNIVYEWTQKRGEVDPGHVIGELFAGQTPDEEDEEL